jgi:hypothetical protein
MHKFTVILAVVLTTAAAARAENYSTTVRCSRAGESVRCEVRVADKQNNTLFDPAVTFAANGSGGAKRKVGEQVWRFSVRALENGSAARWEVTAADRDGSELFQRLGDSRVE